MKAKEKIARTCPCSGCSKPSAWREESGHVVCPDFRKCKKYSEWFGDAWRGATAALSRKEEKR